MKLYTGVLLFLAGITCIASAQEYFVKDEVVLSGVQRKQKCGYRGRPQKIWTRR